MAATHLATVALLAGHDAKLSLTMANLRTWKRHP
jgi:hypothetical protein